MNIAFSVWDLPEGNVNGIAVFKLNGTVVPVVISTVNTAATEHLLTTADVAHFAAHHLFDLVASVTELDWRITSKTYPDTVIDRYGQPYLFETLTKVVRPSEKTFESFDAFTCGLGISARKNSAQRAFMVDLSRRPSTQPEL